ncbi:putative LmbE-like protein [gamma proteobacterium IMCC1989]|nr:putative LmbE-like protein [gamma proteobacterium IMCC1989]
MTNKIEINNERVAIIAAHPDDEILGCGGTIAKHINKGDDVAVLIMAEGITSRDTDRNTEARQGALQHLTDTARQANKKLGVSHVEFGGLPDNRLDSMDLLDVVKVVESFLDQFQPTIIYTHCGSDLNIDHRIVSQAVSTATRPLPNSSVHSILHFEVPSSTEWQTPGAYPTFVPNWFVGIENTLTQKLESLAIYEQEMRDWPHARSIKALEHLAKWRGASIGLNAAEAFSLARHITPED